MVTTVFHAIQSNEAVGPLSTVRSASRWDMSKQHLIGIQQHLENAGAWMSKQRPRLKPRDSG